MRHRLIVLIIAFMIVPTCAFAHCDSLSGPVVADARLALERNDVAPLLKWIRPEDEAQIRAAFARTLAVRQLGPEAKELADMYFFETVVRIHRAGEGAPYTGLKPADAIAPAIVEADHALESGSVDKLAKMISEHAAQELRERFAETLKMRAHSEESAVAGRAYVESYVNYVHYVEALADVIHGSVHHEQEDRHP